jgi:hypothetical protein
VAESRAQNAQQEYESMMHVLKDPEFGCRWGESR